MLCCLFWKHLIDRSKYFPVEHHCFAENSLIFVKGITSQSDVSCLAGEECSSENAQNYPKEEEISTY